MTWEDKHKAMSQDGFTLVEALIAMAIFSIAMLGVASMLYTGLASSSSSNGRYNASVIAQGRMEELMRRPFANVSSHTAPIVETLPAGQAFSTTWNVANTSTNLRTITITTTWTDRIGSHNVVITGMRGD